jgi:Predicted Rossmann fold nucleotide-binding protein
MLKRLAVYCGARAGQDPSFMEMATDFGHQMAEHDVALVYGGGRFGLMGRWPTPSWKPVARPTG